MLADRHIGIEWKIYNLSLIGRLRKLAILQRMAGELDISAWKHVHEEEARISWKYKERSSVVQIEAKWCRTNICRRLLDVIKRNSNSINEIQKTRGDDLYIALYNFLYYCPFLLFYSYLFIIAPAESHVL